MALATTILRVNNFTETKRAEDNSKLQARNLAGSLAGSMTRNENIDEIITKQSVGVGAEITIYDKSGRLISSSQPEIYGDQILSRFVDPVALNAISTGNYSFAIDESIGKLKFRNTYSAILSPSNREVLGIVSIPFFASQESFEKDQIRLVVNILTVFILVFFLFYFVSFAALGSLVKPLRVVSTSLRQTTLSASNKKLVWNSSDEIGSLVKEYNNMIDNLSKSREALERRQREATWREMARQVAHEIKNPLTPIKLTLQQLQKIIQSGQPSSENMTKSLDTVLHQVDILNDIASSFSAFAQMPEPKLERVDIVTLLQGVVSLFDSSRDNKIIFHFSGEPIWVMADYKLFTRIFSNIILNALQSEKEKGQIKIVVGLKVDTPNLTLFFSDNGKGMAKEILDKIFIPYFSTKESGSGLGLAIAKQGIEQAGGKIWCDSTIDVGTTFFISLPITG
jgi:nitrogen fixation/metabolism regulation signal transduction histidine kinase